MLLLAGLSAQKGLPPEVIALARVKQKVETRLSRLPDFTCLETIQRWTRPADSKPFKPVDTVRLEVAHVGEQEVYSWPGAGSFSDRNPGDIIGSGMTATGEFGDHLRSVFLGGSTTFTYAGEESLGGRRVLRWNYRVAPFEANWILRIGGATGAAVPGGSFWVDPETFDILRLEAKAEMIPPHVPASDIRTRIDYAKVAILGADVWLPESAELLLTDRFGQQDRNVVQFSHCRQYTGQSVVTFEETSPAQAEKAVTGATEFQLPIGLSLALELETEVDSERARVGDPIVARVAADARAGRTNLVIPKGALVKGRIRRLEKESAPVPHWIVGLEFNVL